MTHIFLTVRQGNQRFYSGGIVGQTGALGGTLWAERRSWINEQQGPSADAEADGGGPVQGAGASLTQDVAVVDSIVQLLHGQLEQLSGICAVDSSTKARAAAE